MRVPSATLLCAALLGSSGAAAGDLDAKQVQWVRKQVEEFEKSELKKQEEKVTPGRLQNLLLNNLKLKADVAYTDNNSVTGGPGTAIPERFGDDETVWNLALGYYDKPLHEFKRFLTHSKVPETRREIDLFVTPILSILNDATLEAYVKYGKTRTDPEGSDNFTTKRKFTFYIGASYEIAIREIPNLLCRDR